jgi:hypothetical protein
VSVGRNQRSWYWRTQLETEANVIAATRLWLEKAVIGLGLCPFASAVHQRQQIRYCVSAQSSSEGLVQDLIAELHYLQNADSQLCETTLLIHPYALNDFRDYNEFLNEADAAVRDNGLEGELQIASFHPHYQFGGSEPDDIENYSNRSPYPMLHLLREASVTRAVDALPGKHDIAGTNGATLKRLGKDGWERLWVLRGN